jgi:hypothetical protein
MKVVEHTPGGKRGTTLGMVVPEFVEQRDGELRAAGMSSAGVDERPSTW